jgi:adenine-specific DNA-methyltransferase
MNGESLNIKDDNLNKLKSVLPELFSEDQLDWEKLKAHLGDNMVIANERYTLNWAGKSDAFKALQQPTTATLKPSPEESINFETTGNVFIEGENLEVLKVLQKSYYGKVKCIIIDPPYNTGSDSFIYPDSFKENKADYEKRIGDKDEDGYVMKEGYFRKNSKDSGHFHSNWLSMMYPRLFLAKNLLRDDGAIFIFIDDNECDNLRLVMNEIFGEENFVASIVWKHTEQSKNDEKYFSRQYNSIICYRKSSSLQSFRFERTEEDNRNYSNPDDDPKGDWRSGDVRSPHFRKTLCYEIDTPSGKKIQPPENGWRWSHAEVLKKISSGEIIFDKNENKITRKIYLVDQEGRTPENLWNGERYGTTRAANAEIKELFEEIPVFDTPKPSIVIKRIIELLSQKDEGHIIFDFFSGSGTTAHAVLDLNNEDGGNRRFALIQLPEPCNEKSEAFKSGYKTISEISKERIRRVIQKIQKEKAAKPDFFDTADLDLGFKVFKLISSNFKIWRGNEITEENLTTQLDAFTNPVKQGREKENMFYELLLKAGYQLTDRIEKHPLFYSVKDNELIVALETMSPEVVEVITKSLPKPNKVVTLDILFANNDQLKTNTVLQMKDAGIDFKTI